MLEKKAGVAMVVCNDKWAKVSAAHVVKAKGSI